MEIIENTILNLSDFKKEDYDTALSAVSKYLKRIGVKQIDGMEAHDFAVEAIMQSARWGGREFIRRRAKLVVIEKIRDSTGSRRTINAQKKWRKAQVLNGLSFESFYLENNIDKEVEELLESLEIPEDLKHIIYLRVFKNMTLKQIGFATGVSESGICGRIKKWKEKLKEAVKIKMNDKGRNHLLEKI